MKSVLNRIRIFAIFATVLMLGTLATPVSAGSTADEKKYEIDKLLYDLEDAVASYNEAVAEGYPEDAEGYAKDIAEILGELQALGVGIEVVFDETQETPLTMEVAEGKVILTIGQDNSPKVLIIALAVFLGKNAKIELKQWAIGRCASPLCGRWTADGPLGLPFCGHSWCPATILNFYEQSKA